MVSKIEFPLFVMWKDCGDFHVVNSLDELAYRVEPNDILFEEFLLWDKAGRQLSCGQDSTGKIRLEETPSIGRNLAAVLNRQLDNREIDFDVRDESQFLTAVGLLQDQKNPRRKTSRK